jgi:citrate lyase subunit beta/citryl-CoA lyase
MHSAHQTLRQLVRRSKLFVPVNRERFVARAWTRGADCIILDLEDAVAPAEKEAARRLVARAASEVARGGADVQVRINRGMEDEDLDAVVIPGVASVMIPKCESPEEIQDMDDAVAQWEGRRGLPQGAIQFDLLIETARGVVNVERIAQASQRIVQVNMGQADLSVDMGFPRFPDMNFQQYAYAEDRLRFAAHAARVQPCGLGAQNRVDFTSISMGSEAMVQACRQAYWLGYMGALLIHPGWVEAANEGFSPPESDLALARRVKAAMEEACARGEGSVQVEGRMYDMANVKYVEFILERAEAVSRREAQKARALAQAGQGG